MRSVTKNRLSNEQLLTLVQENFGDEMRVGQIEELKGGMFNTAYRIECTSGEENMVLKVSVKPDILLLSYEKNTMPTEVEVYRLLAEKTAVPAPKLLCSDLTKHLVDSNYFFMTELCGSPMDQVKRRITPANMNTIKRELGGYFAQIHLIKGQYFGYFTQDESHRYTTWKAAFLAMVRMILDDGYSLGVKLPYERIESTLIEKASLLEDISEPTLVDYDIWSGNIFLVKDGEGYKIEGIVDFERAFWGDPYADFAAAFFIAGNLWEDAAFWEGYTSIAGKDKVISRRDRARLLMYWMYIFLNMAVETYRYGFLHGQIQKLLSRSQVLKCLKLLDEALI
jgi:fructosamine-3-kinase